MTPEIQVLWNPEKGPCQQCGMMDERVRRFTAQGNCTVFCIHCWNGFLDDECNINPNDWTRSITSSWNEDVALCLEYDNGIAQEIANWN